MTKQATLYRMVLPDHMCPSGLKAKALLEKQGFDIDDKPLTSRDAVDAFKNFKWARRAGVQAAFGSDAELFLER